MLYKWSSKKKQRQTVDNTAEDRDADIHTERARHLSNIRRQRNTWEKFEYKIHKIFTQIKFVL